jgi:hypothetical protein
MRSPQMPLNNTYVWELPDEVPGTLEEIFAAEDSRCSNLIIYEFRSVDGFRKCWEAIGVPGDPYDLIGAVRRCIGWHLKPIIRQIDYQNSLRDRVRYTKVATTALEKLSLSINNSSRIGLLSINNARNSDSTVSHTIEYLKTMTITLDSILAKSLKNKGGRPKKVAFRQLILGLAGAFEGATGNRPTITRNHHVEGGYGGKFWNLVEVVLPIVNKIIQTSRASSLDKPASDGARGKYIEELLREREPRKPLAAPG